MRKEVDVELLLLGKKMRNKLYLVNLILIKWYTWLERGNVSLILSGKSSSQCKINPTFSLLPHGEPSL
jgi:hypothetical protein